MSTLKTCSKCKIEIEFLNPKESYCPICKAIYNKEWRIRHKERDYQRKKKWTEENREHVRQHVRINWERHKKKYNRHRKQIDTETYQFLLEKQKGLCAICFQPEIVMGSGNKIRPLCIDHNHDTGNIRGLLCARCNSGIGLLMDDTVLLESAIKYLKEYNE